jgi:hypothetical protein
MNLLFETESKTVPITKEMVRVAYRKVKSNQGSAGVEKPKTPLLTPPTTAPATNPVPITGAKATPPATPPTPTAAPTPA